MAGTIGLCVGPRSSGMRADERALLDDLPYRSTARLITLVRAEQLDVLTTVRLSRLLPFA